MPTALFDMPDGSVQRFSVPEGTSPEDAHSMFLQSLEQAGSDTNVMPNPKVPSNPMANTPDALMETFKSDLSTNKSKELKSFDAQQDIAKNLVNESNKTLDPTAASRKSMLENAQVNLDAANKILLNPDGTVNDIAAITGRNNIPWTKGSQANNALQNAIAAQLRAETGAGAPASEIEEMSKRFMPSAWDSEDEQKQKLQNIQRLIDGTYTNMLPKLDAKSQQSGQSARQQPQQQVIPYTEYFK